ncbi:hypothetical protein ACFDTO_18285 [Microbacteriaceae bacterium 4G12]
MKYTYEDLVRDVNIGHDIEFIFNGKLYGIINVREGFGLGEDKKKFKYFKTPQELLDNGTIDEKSLKEIWGEVEFFARL